MNRAEQIIYITGATSGIGLATARLLHRERRGKLVLLARTEEKLKALAQELDAHAHRIDLAEAATRESNIQQAFEQYGPPDVLINSAGFGQYVPFMKTTEDEHNQLMQVNYFAPAALIHAALPHMLEKNSGHVINIASVAATFGPYGHGPYAAAKAALIRLTQTLAVEHETTRVRFSYINPGVVRTPFFDNPGYDGLQHQVKRHGIEPERVAAAVARLLDRPQLALTVPWHYRFAEWIGVVSPSLLRRIVAANSRPNGHTTKEKNSE